MMSCSSRLKSKNDFCSLTIGSTAYTHGHPHSRRRRREQGRMIGAHKNRMGDTHTHIHTPTHPSSSKHTGKEPTTAETRKPTATGGTGRHHWGTEGHTRVQQKHLAQSRCGMLPLPPLPRLPSVPRPHPPTLASPSQHPHVRTFHAAASVSSLAEPMAFRISSPQPLYSAKDARMSGPGQGKAHTHAQTHTRAHARRSRTERTDGDVDGHRMQSMQAQGAGKREGERAGVERASE